MWPWPTSWQRMIHILQIKQLKASLNLWKSNMVVKTVLIISHYFQFPWIRYKYGLYEKCFVRPEAVSVWFNVGEFEKGCKILSSCPLHHDMVVTYIVPASFFFLIFTKYLTHCKVNDERTIHSIHSFIMQQ